MSYVDEYVAAGAARLDEALPLWRLRVDTTGLIMWHPKLCVLGQLFGDYPDGITKLGIRTMDEAVSLGFVPNLTLGNAYNELQAAWVRYLAVESPGDETRGASDDRDAGAGDAGPGGPAQP